MNKYVKALLASAFFLGCLLATYYLRISYGKVDVVLYSAILGTLVATALAGALIVFSSHFSDFTGLEKIQLVLIWLLAGYAFSVSVPTVIDRSLSFYILEKLQQRGGGIRHDRFEDMFIKEYMVEHRLVDVRLTEQLESGTITIDQGCVRLTPRGDRLASFSRFFRAHLLPKQRLLMGKYSDDLTDPFRHSRTDMDYACQ